MIIDTLNHLHLHVGLFSHTCCHQIKSFLLHFILRLNNRDYSRTFAKIHLLVMITRESPYEYEYSNFYTDAYFEHVYIIL